MSEPVNNYFRLCIYSQLGTNHRIFNIHEIDTHILLKIPDDLPSSYEIYQIDRLEPTFVGDDVNISTCVSRQFGHPWVDIDTSCLDLNVGYHLYCIRLIERRTEDITKLYFSYTVQDNDPTASYRYMDKYRTSNTSE